MTRTEIELSRKISIMESEKSLREEYQRGFTVMDEKVGALKDQVGALQRDVTTLQNGQGDIQATLRDMASSLTDLSAKLDGVSHQTETVTRETADGREIVTKIRSWKTAWGDVKSPLTYIFAGIAALAWKITGAWFAAHGITIQAMFAHH